MSKGLGFLQSNIQNMLQTGETLTVSDVMAVAGPSYDPRHIRRAFKSMHRRGKVVLTVKRGVLAVKARGGGTDTPVADPAGTDSPAADPAGTDSPAAATCRRET